MTNTKKDILAHVIKILEESINELGTSVTTLEATSDLDEETTIDQDDLSRQSETTDLGMRLQQPLTNIQNNLNIVRQFANTDRNEISSGALVETNHKWFLIGVSLASMDINGKPLIGISTDAPAFAQLEGKEQGDAFSLGDTTYTISAIF